MDFTREPIIETVITPKEGCKLVIRSSKRETQEEFFVDSVEVITFGSAIFLRSQEKPKSFIVPASDYEVVEVKEARIVLKNASLGGGGDRSIKIAGGRDSNARFENSLKQPPIKQGQDVEEKDIPVERAPLAQGVKEGSFPHDRKKDRRRQGRRRARKDEGIETTADSSSSSSSFDLESSDLPLKSGVTSGTTLPQESPEVYAARSQSLAALLTPPPLISETIGRYKEQYKDAFYTKEEQENKTFIEAPKEPIVSLEQPLFGSFEVSEDAEEEIYQQRRRKYIQEAENFSEESSNDSEKTLFGNDALPSFEKEEENDSKGETHFPLES